MTDEQDATAQRPRRGRRRDAVVAAAALIAAAGNAAVACSAAEPEGRGTPVARDPASADDRLSYEDLAASFPEDSVVPPVLVFDAGGTAVDAQLSTYCWANGCADTVAPPVAGLPDVGRADPLRAAYPTTGQWHITVSGDTNYAGCDHYPVLVEASADRILTLTPSGPAGARVGSFFVYPSAGGDVTGFWRWTVPPRDGVPTAWVSLSQNSPGSGGAADLRVVVDDAAVDGDVSARVTVTAANGSMTSLEPTEVDQHCRGDGFVELAVPSDTPDRLIDGMGPTPYDFAVDLTIDGTTYTGVGTWSGEGTEYGGDARLTFDPPLPAGD